RASRRGGAHGLCGDRVPELPYAHRRVGVLPELRRGAHGGAGLAQARTQAARGSPDQGEDIVALTCARCGAQNPDGNLYCQTCGTPLTAAGAVAGAPPTAPPAAPPGAFAGP